MPKKYKHPNEKLGWSFKFDNGHIYRFFGTRREAIEWYEKQWGRNWEEAKRTEKIRLVKSVLREEDWSY